MSDTPQGPGWWQASDGKWYPPEQAPATTAMPGAAAAYGGGVAGTTLADWSQRAIAYIIDIGLVIGLFVVGMVLTVVMGAIADALGALVGLIFYLAYFVAWLYLGFLVGSKGASPGMALTGLRCVGEETGQPIGGGMGVLRSFAHILDSLICYIGWFLPLWDSKNQTIADKVVKTLVYSGQPKQSFSLDLFKP